MLKWYITKIYAGEVCIYNHTCLKDEKEVQYIAKEMTIKELFETAKFNVYKEYMDIKFWKKKGRKKNPYIPLL